MPVGEEQITGSWVELRERCGEGRTVLMRADADVPPARGRRMIALAPGNMAQAGDPGPSDKLEGPSGRWELKAGRLHIDLPGWTGVYRVEKTDKETLTLLTD